MLALIRGEPDAVIRYFRQLVVGGLLLNILAANFRTPGVITGVFALALGAAGRSLVHWRTERGQWLQGGLFFLIFSAAHVFITIGVVRDILGNVAPPSAGVVIDFTTGTALLSANIRFLLRVVDSTA